MEGRCLRGASRLAGEERLRARAWSGTAAERSSADILQLIRRSTAVQRLQWATRGVWPLHGGRSTGEDDDGRGRGAAQPRSARALAELRHKGGAHMGGRCLGGRRT